MRQRSRKSLLVILLVICALTPKVYASDHKYHTGFLASMSSDRVVVTGKTFVLRPDVRVLVKYKERGAYYEKKGSLYDVHLGDRVYLKATGNSVSEIVVMR